MNRTEQALANGIRGFPVQASRATRQLPFPPVIKTASSTGNDNTTGRRNEYPNIPWLTQSWLAKNNRYERIATASPRMGIGLISQGLLEHHIALLPGFKSAADFIPVRNEDGESAGYRAKVRTWPLLKRETIEVREIAA